jgi:membrane protein DedA with SNARE-associated domain
VDEWLIDALWRVGPWGYLLVFAGAALESAAFLGLLVPGETIVIVSGVLASWGYFGLARLIAVVAVGAIVGDNVSYRLGRQFGLGWFDRYGRRVGFDRAQLDRVQRFYDRYGGAALVLGRFVGFVRPLVPFVAGTAGMPYPRFVAYNALAGALWAVVTVLIGFFLGESWRVAERWIGRAGLIALGVVAVVVVGFWLRRRRRAASRR